MDADYARHGFDNMHPKPLELICYHTQQSTEKLLKGFIVANETAPPKTHNLIFLLDACVQFYGGFDSIRTCLGKLNSYSSQPRYPYEIEITEEDTKQALNNMDIVTDFFRQNIRGFDQDCIQEEKKPQS
jgi:HEPN domain-containing protein